MPRRHAHGFTGCAGVELGNFAAGTIETELVFKPANSLVDQSLHCHEGKAQTNGDGFGIGW